jgi:ParB family chromosome partitioning protein
MGLMLSEKQLEIEMELKYIPIDKIDVSEGNVRKRKLTLGLDELKKSLDLIGLQQPVVVFPKDDRYELIIGQRRLYAAKQLGWKTIPALIRKPTNITEAKIISLSENIQRVRLSPKDMSEACNYLFEKLGSAKAVAEALGVSQMTVNKYLSFHRIAPEPIKKLVEEKKITVPDAMKIVAYVWPDKEKAIKIAEKIAEMPRPEKERVFDVIRETPEKPVEKIFERAEETKVRKEFIIHFPENYALALEKAAEDRNMEPEDVVKDVVIEWLQENGYV